MALCFLNRAPIMQKTEKSNITSDATVMMSYLGSF